MKKKQLYFRQKDLLNKFLERNAITKAEYEKSLGDLNLKMGMNDLRETYDGTR